MLYQLTYVGGDEFAVLLDDCTAEEADEIAERLRRAGESAGGVSVGLARGDARREGITEIVARADGALYEAKRLGRNRVVLAA